MILSDADLIADRYLLYKVLHDRELSFEEFRNFDLVALEVPPISKAGYEHDILKLVTNIRSVGPHVMIIVQPSLRKRAIRCLWIQKWNHMAEAPFRFSQTCSCKTPGNTSQCHFTYYVGTTAQCHLEACDQVPTMGASVDAASRGICGLLLLVCQC